MTTMDINETLPLAAERAGFFTRLAKAFATWRATNRAHRTIIELSRLDSRLLRDIGVEPIDVYEALNRRAGPSVLFNPMRRDDHE